MRWRCIGLGDRVGGLPTIAQGMFYVGIYLQLQGSGELGGASAGADRHDRRAAAGAALQPARHPGVAEHRAGLRVRRRRRGLDRHRQSAGAGEYRVPGGAAGRPVRAPSSVLSGHYHYHLGCGWYCGRPRPHPSNYSERLARIWGRPDTRQWQCHAGLRLPAGRARPGLRLPNHRLACWHINRVGCLRIPAAVRQLGQLCWMAVGVPDNAAHWAYCSQVLPAGCAP